MDTDTLQLIPNVTPIPVYSDINAIKQAIGDILHILQHPTKNNIPTVLKGDAIKQAFKEVAILLKNDKSQKIPQEEVSTNPTMTLRQAPKRASSHPQYHINRHHPPA